MPPKRNKRSSSEVDGLSDSTAKRLKVGETEFGIEETNWDADGSPSELILTLLEVPSKNNKRKPTFQRTESTLGLGPDTPLSKYLLSNITIRLIKHKCCDKDELIEHMTELMEHVKLNLHECSSCGWRDLESMEWFDCANCYNHICSKCNQEAELINEKDSNKLQTLCQSCFDMLNKVIV